MRCAQCGAEVSDDDRFCVVCGAPVTRPVAASVGAAVASGVETTAPARVQSQATVLPPPPPVQASTPAVLPPPPSAQASTARPNRGTAVGGAVGIGGALLILVACALPSAHYGSASPSVFNPGFPGGFWFATEPIAVILMALAAGLTIVVSGRRRLQIAGAAILLGIGVQTFFFFAGIVGQVLSATDASVGTGAIVGIVGALCLTGGGLIAAIRAGLWGRVPTD